MVDYVKWHWHKDSHIWLHISVDIVFNFVPADLHCIVLLFLQFGPIMLRHGNTYMIKSVCYEVISNNFFH